MSDRKEFEELVEERLEGRFSGSGSIARLTAIGGLSKCSPTSPCLISSDLKLSDDVDDGDVDLFCLRSKTSFRLSIGKPSMVELDDRCSRNPSPKLRTLLRRSKSSAVIDSIRAEGTGNGVEAGEELDDLDLRRPNSDSEDDALCWRSSDFRGCSDR